jgi:endonuclease YncB( thermonuclease family)
MGMIIPFRRRRNWAKPSAYGAREKRAVRGRGLRSGRGWLRFAPLWAVAAGAGLLIGSGTLPEGIDFPELSRFGQCHFGGGRNCVVDGDTFWMDGQKIRIAGIDAPETHPSRCKYEAWLGSRATARLRQLLNQGEVSLVSIDRDRDRYGRLLRNVEVDGRDVGEVLIGEGLARPFGNGRKSWCA